jgi:hypothetical protein
MCQSIDGIVTLFQQTALASMKPSNDPSVQCNLRQKYDGTTNRGDVVALADNSGHPTLAPQSTQHHFRESSINADPLTLKTSASALPQPPPQPIRISHSRPSFTMAATQEAPVGRFSRVPFGSYHEPRN